MLISKGDLKVANQSDARKTQSRQTAGKKRNRNKVTALGVLGRIGIVLLTTLAIIFVWLYGVMAILCKGPSKTAKKQFVLSVQETSAIGFLANWFCSQEEIEAIKASNQVKDTQEISNTELVDVTAAAQDAERPDIEVVDVKGSTYRGKLMKIKDPTRLFVGTVPQFMDGDGMVVADIAARYGAIGGVNGGEFLDGVNGNTFTAKPIGLVMKDGQVLNGQTGTWHVTGITNDNKIIVGNMDANKAKESNIRDCVSIKNEIGPFLVINGEPQDIDGTGGGYNPRTAIGQASDGTILLLVIDGRMVNSIGASFYDLQEIMVENDAVNASVMDGGTSSQMYYDGSVINTPYSPTGPRTCPTAFLIK